MPGKTIPARSLNRILRWLGILCSGYLAIRMAFSVSIPLETKIVCVLLNLLLAFGFLRLNRKFFLTVAILMVVMICTQAFFTNLWISSHQHISAPILEHPWMLYARSIRPHLVIMICAVALYLRLPHRSQHRSQKAERSDGGDSAALHDSP